MLLLNLSPLGAELLAAKRQLLPLALRGEQLQFTELAAASPYADGVSVLIQLDPVTPWKRNSQWPGLQLYEPQVTWTDELIDPLPLPAQELAELQQLVLGYGMVDDHEGVAVQSLTHRDLLVADVIDGLILNRRDESHARALAGICEPTAQRQLLARRRFGQGDCHAYAPAPPDSFVVGMTPAAQHHYHPEATGPELAANPLTTAGLLAVALVETVCRTWHA